MEETEIKAYVVNDLRMTITSDGGDLHGSWNSEAIMTTSDRRLKTSIEPLYRTLAGQLQARSKSGSSSSSLPLQGAALQQQQQPGMRGAETPVNWLLRELRPVSFRLKRGPEAKYLKFGFIAQELENVFPNLVRTTGVDDTKSVAMQDLVAVLTLALQMLQKDFDEQTKRFDEQTTRFDEQTKRLERLERYIFGQAAAAHDRPMHV
jgi:hypothetical protein